MKDQAEIPEALRLADICAKKGMFAVEDELRRLHAESELHLQELRSYRITVENREARIAELEKQLAEAQQGVRNRVLVDAGALQMVVNALRRDALEGRPSRGEMADELLSSATHPAQQGLDAQQALQKVHAIAASALRTGSRDRQDWIDDMERIAAQAKQGGAA